MMNLCMHLSVAHQEIKCKLKHVIYVPESTMDSSYERTPWLTNMATKDYTSQHCSHLHWPKF